jgi:hypothetical protein
MENYLTIGPNFHQWMRTKKPDEKWDPADLQSEFVIEIHQRQESKDIPCYIRIIDPFAQEV